MAEIITKDKLPNYTNFVGHETTDEKTTLYELNEDGTINYEKPISEEVETQFAVGTSSELDTSSDTQIPTSKAVKSLIDSDLGSLEEILGGI